MTTSIRIRRDEALPGTLLFAHLFFTVASIVVGKAARDAIFLSRFTALQMTAVDALTMLAVAGVVAVQLRLNARIHMRRLLLISPLCFALGDVGLSLGVSTSHGGWLTWVAYLWIGVQASFGTPQASVLANHMLTIRQAKGLYGLVGAGAILGWIGGGLIAQGLSTHFGASSLLIGAGMLTALCPAIVSIAWRDDEGSAVDDHVPGSVRDTHSLRQSASLVWSSPHLRAIAALALISSAVTTIAGLQFKAIASQTIHSADHLAAFFGSFSLHAGLLALAMQVLLTSQVIGRLGLGLALAIAPCALAIGSAGVLCSGNLGAAVFLKGSDQVLRYSVDRSAVESLYRPLPQRQIFEGKTVIDVLVCRLGDTIGALLALFAAMVLHLSFSWLGAISVALLPGWFVAAEIARRRYRGHLVETLRHQHHQPPRLETSGPASSKGLPSIDSTRPDPQAVLNPDPAIRLEVLQQLCHPQHSRKHVKKCERLLTMALAAEIVGVAVLVETASSRNESRDDHRREVLNAIERISKLLFLLAPDRYPGCLSSAFRSGDAALEATALEYLDVTLATPHRQLLVPTLDRWALAA